MALEAQPLNFDKIVLDWLIGREGDQAFIFIVFAIMFILILASRFRMTGYAMAMSVIGFLLIMFSLGDTVSSAAGAFLSFVVVCVALIGAKYFTPQ